MNTRVETDLQNDVLAYLNKCKIFHFRTQMGNLSGYPDIIACINGKFVGIELKRENGKGRATAQQKLMKADIEASNGICLITNKLEDVIALVNNHHWQV